VRLTICLSDVEVQAIKQAAVDNDRSVSGVVRRAVKAAIARGELNG